MVRLLLLAVAGVLVLGMPLSAGRTRAAPASQIDALDAFLAKTLNEYQVPGAAVAVIQDGEIVLVKGYGVRDATKPDPVDEHTIFQLASVTKTLTGLAAASVVEEGALDWDTPITNYLPEFVGYDPYMTRWLTMRDLLAHRSGWPAFTGDSLDNFGYGRAEILHRLRYLEPRYSLREVAQYGNPNFFVAGEVAARAAGMSWNELVEQRLYAPLGMTRSGLSVNDLQDPNASAAHALIEGKLTLVPPTKQDTMGAAGSGTSTAADMAQLLQMLLQQGRHGETQVLEPASVAEVFKRSMVGELTFAELPPTSEATGFFYGLGVDSFDYAGHHIINKAGALSGVRTLITLVPDLNAGIVVLANLNVTAFPEAARAYWLNQLLGLDPMADQAEILQINEQLKGLFDPPPPPADPVPFNGSYSALAGTYENRLYGQCTITVDGDTLAAACGPAQYAATLTHWNNGQFNMQFPGATSTPSAVTFTIGVDGSADSFFHETFGLFTRIRPAGSAN